MASTPFVRIPSNELVHTHTSQHNLEHNLAQTRRACGIMPASCLQNPCCILSHLYPHASKRRMGASPMDSQSAKDPRTEDCAFPVPNTDIGAFIRSLQSWLCAPTPSIRPVRPGPLSLLPLSSLGSCSASLCCLLMDLPTNGPTYRRCALPSRHMLRQVLYFISNPDPLSVCLPTNYRRGWMGDSPCRLIWSWHGIKAKSRPGQHVATMAGAHWLICPGMYISAMPLVDRLGPRISERSLLHRKEGPTLLIFLVRVNTSTTRPIPQSSSSQPTPMPITSTQS